MSAWNGLPGFIRSRWISAFTVLALLVAMLTVGALPGVLGVRVAAADQSCDTSALPPPSDTTVAPGQAATIQQDGATVALDTKAVSAPVTIEAQSLCASSLPPLDPGMTLVTAGNADGYRFLPHMTFKDNLSITVPYDSVQVPDGLTEQDVQIYYYDTTQTKWVPLQRKNLDQAGDNVASLSNHFTDMVAATVTVPDHPENVNFDPTSIKDLKAADPSAGVDLINQPQGNNQGDARLSYPIDLPQGRQGMTPSLELSYSSSAGDGWLGVGWDLSVPSIGIDTKWGVPRYDPANETETYVMGGAEMTPVANRGALQPRTAEKTFHARVEGAFNTIVRHGSAPTNYWWEVTDKDGTRSFYGGDPESGPVAAASLADDNGNVFRWALRETRDRHGNAVRYDYQTVSDAGVSGGTVMGRQLYLRTIDYTRTGSTAGPYAVTFVRDSELPGYSRRPDVVIDARGGFKMVTAERLSRIDVSFQGNPVRSYDLTYTEGAFHKSLLASVTQRGANGGALGTHTFSYYDDIRDASGQYDAFSPAADWQVGDDNVTSGLLGHGKASALSGSLSTTVGGHLYVGFNPLLPLKQGSVGGKVGFTRSTTDGKLALIDLNGDDLPDKVFKGSGGISFRLNASGPDGSTSFGPAVPVPTLPAISKSSSNTVSFGPESYLTANVFANHAVTFSTTSVYFNDVNGDGLPDLVNDGAVLFNHLDGNGVPTFTANSNDTPVPIGSGILDDSGLVQDFGADRDQEIQNSPLTDTVRRWEAPFDGTVKVAGDVVLVQDTSPARASYPNADGVRVAIQRNGSELWSTAIGADDYAAKTPTGVSSIAVSKGDRLYFRVGSQFDGSYDQVSWDPVVSYLDVDPAPDANGLDGGHYKASQDFTLAGRRGMQVQAPLNGAVHLTGALHKLGATTDDVTVVVTKNGDQIASQRVDAGATGDVPIDMDIDVAKQDAIALQVQVDSPIDLSKLDWAPSLYYVSSPDVSTLTDDNGDPLIQLHPPYDIDTYPVDDLTGPQQAWTAPADETVTVTPDVTAASGADGSLTFTVKRPGELVAKRAITLSNGQASPAPFDVDVQQGDRLFFDFSVRDPQLNAKITATSVQVTRPSSAPVTVPSAVHAAAFPGVLAAPYRGWSYVGYNGAGARETAPITEADLNQTFDQSSTYDPQTAKAYVFLPFPEERSWRGADDSAWVKASSMSSSRQGAAQISVPTTSEVAGARAVSRLGHGTQDAVGGGVSLLSGSLDDGSTSSDVDYLDLNGDRFPDIVSTGKVQYSTLTGGLEASNRAVPGLDAPREADASSANVGVGGSPAHFTTNSAGRVGMTGSQMVALGLSADLGKGSTKPKRELLDVNGDGLPDQVSRDGSTLMVALNLGYGFATAEPWGTAAIDDEKSENGTIGATLGFNSGIYDFAGGLSLTKDKAATTETLQDVNGDGLADRVLAGGDGGMQVGLNTGTGFAAPVAWNGAIDGACHDDTSVGLAGIDWNHARICSGSTGLGAGAYFTIGIGPLCLPAPTCYIIINPGADASQTMSRDEATLQDIDGDGYADDLASSSDGTLHVAHNRTGRTNLLKSVSRPLGASFSLDYARDGNTVADPSSHWLLTKVSVDDGHVGDGADTQLTTYTYAGGVYDRLEREFYGYAHVTEEQRDTTSSNAVYRSVVRDFATNSYYMKGLQLRQRTYDAAGGLFADSESTYVLRDVGTGAEPAGAASTTATIFPMLTRTDERYNEGGPTAVKSTATINHYDALGDIDVLTELGDTGSADDVTAQIGYSSCPGTGVRTPTSITVYGGSTLMRHRESNVDCANGDVTQVRQYLAGGAASTTDISYTGDGNILMVTDPPNASGQRATLTYGYDPATRSQVERITDNFGLTSTATHDLRFGTVLTQTDENGSVENSTYDEFGRQTSLTGPYEQDSGTPTIRFEYHPEATAPWAITRHLDKFRSATDTIDTVVLIDGLRRQIQTKKDATVYTGASSAPADVMIVTGAVTYDAFGRQTAARYPVTEPLGTPGTFDASVDAIAPTRTTYDVLDRATRTTFPDGTTTATAYGFGPDRSGATEFEQTVTDPNGHRKLYYHDVRQQLVSLKQLHTPSGGSQQAIWTSYAYDPLSQLVQVTDDKNNATRQSFDNLGRRTVVDNPDTGKTDTTYDLASNKVAEVTANLRASSQQISYGYDYDRLVSISYPQFPANNVTYAYGNPGASDNRAGRITRVTDEGGAQDRYYGKLGEVTKEVQTVVGFTGSSPKSYTTSYVYDTFGRMQSLTYPDGEVLTYQYDSGGMVRAASGVKGSNAYHYVNRAQYDKFGQKAFIEDGNGVQTTYAFDPVMRRLSNQVAGPLLDPNGVAVGPFQNLTYTYDNVGNVTSAVNNLAVPTPPVFGGPSTQTFRYDDLDRLTDAAGSYQYEPGKTNRYTDALSYDNLHNITSKTQTNDIVQPSGKVVPQKKTTYAYAYAYAGSQPHAPTHIGAQTYTYDLNGNQTGWTDDKSGQRRTIVWDEENRIQSIFDNGHQATYKYDDAGQRVIKRGPQGETAYVNQFFTIRNGTIGTKHVFIDSTRVASKLMKADGTYEKDVYYDHSDHLASNNEVTDASGKPYEHLEYFPSGETWIEEKSDTQRTPYQFAGKELDEDTALYYFGARYYDPQTGVWQSPDPDLADNLAKLTNGDASPGANDASPGANVAAPTFLNVYDYAEANPVTNADPDGRASTPTTIGAKGLEYLEWREKFCPKPYIPEPGDVLTIGYGETRGVTSKTPPVTEPQARATLIQHANSRYASQVTAVVNKYHLTLSQDQFDALTSFAYNGGHLNGQSVASALRSGDPNRIVAAMALYNKAKNKAGVRVVNKGLVNRRKEEADLFLHGTLPTAVTKQPPLGKRPYYKTCPVKGVY
ncbi:MAG: SpvB/TcaC N-terminal domain-containing protein [Frankiaceae bacterium]